MASQSTPRTPGKLANYQLGELFSERKEKGREGIPIVSVTINDGLVPRDKMERRIESSLEPSDHLLVRKDDITYNMMRMWQGVSALAEADCLVSPAYVVVTPARDKIDPLFAAFLFKDSRMIRKFHRYSQGLTDDRLRLYFDQFKDIPVTIPESLEEQRQIGESLRAVEVRYSALEDELEQCVALQNALSQKLFGYWDPEARKDVPDAG